MQFSFTKSFTRKIGPVPNETFTIILCKNSPTALIIFCLFLKVSLVKSFQAYRQSFLDQVFALDYAGKSRRELFQFQVCR